MDEKTLAAVTHEIEENLARLKIEKDASYALESEEFKKEFAERLSIAGIRLQTIETELLPRLQSGITGFSVSDDQKSILTQMISRVHDLRSLYESVLGEEHKV